MMRRRFLLFSGLLYLLFLASVATLNGSLMALALPWAVFLLAAIAYGPRKVDLHIERSLSDDRVRAGEPITVDLVVRNDGDRLEQVWLSDRLQEGIKVIDGAAQVFASLEPGETVEWTYRVRAKRGAYTFNHLNVVASDHLGLVQRRSTVSARESVLVLPRVRPLREVPIRPLKTHSFAGPIPSGQSGSGVDFFGVRRYQLGDPLRWVNWRVSARYHEEVFTNEFEQGQIADVGLILDARGRTEVVAGGESLFGYSVRAAASLAEAFLAEGHHVGLLIYGGFLHWSFPGYGKIQRERILRALAEAEVAESQVFSKLESLPTRFFPAGSQVVFVSPLCSDDLSMLFRLRGAGYSVMVVSPDPVAFEASHLGDGAGVELASRMARLERVLLLRQLHHAGVRVLDWQVEVPFDQAVHTRLDRLPHRVRGV